MQRSLRFRLIVILITLAIGPVLLVGAMIAQRSLNFERTQAYDLQNQVARNVATEVESVFIGINNDLSTLGNEIRSLENPDQAQQLSLMLSGISSGPYSDFYNELTLLDRNGHESVRLSPEEIVSNTDLIDRSGEEEFKQPVASRTTYYSPAVIDPSTGSSYIMVAIPLYRPRSTTLSGVLIAEIRLEAVGNIISRAQVGEHQTIYLTNVNGDVLAHQDRTKNLGGLRIQLPRPVATQSGLEGENAILAADRIQLGDQSLYIVAEKPVSIALDLAYTIINTIAIVILLAVVAASALGYLAARQIVAPIEELASFAGRVAKGDLTQKASVSHRDEIGVLAMSFNSMTSQLLDLFGSLERRVDERTSQLAESTKQLQKRASQLEAIANTARSATTAENLNDLLGTITREVSARFGFYHVGIFLVDASRQYAILSAANSEGGRTMLARGHRLKIGEQGIVGFVTSRGEARIALDVGQDAIFFNNPDLPDTHSEFALPLKFGHEIIGALDIQSKERNAFSQEDVEIFSILADQISVVIQNSRSFAQAQRALREAEMASSQLAGQAWKRYEKRIQTRGYRYDGVRSEPLKEADAASELNRDLDIPVQLRDQTIGHLKLNHSGDSREWTEDELAMAKATAERVALALEGARLLEDAQKRAAREIFLSDVSAKLGTSFQMDSIMRDTVEELGQTLKHSTVTFQLVNPSETDTTEEQKHNGTSAHEKESE